MSITQISRNFNGTPNIVFIQTTNDLATITTTGYLATQIDNIELINNGAFEFLSSDILLISYSDGVGFFNVDIATQSIILPSEGLTPGDILFGNSTGGIGHDHKLFWDAVNHRLGVGTNTPQVPFDLNGILNIWDNSKAYNGGLATESGALVIDFGINDSRFGGQLTPDQGGFIRMDGRANNPIFQIFFRNLNEVSPTGGPYLSLNGTRANLALAGAGLFTTETDGFPYMPTMAGTPSGVATSLSGLVPFVWDSTNNALKTYNSGWKDPVGNQLFTWTPTIGDGTHNFTTTTASGTYTQIGNLINFWIQLVWTSIGSASGNILVSLPVAVGASTPRMAANIGFVSGVTALTQILLDGNTGAANLAFWTVNSGSAPSAIASGGFAAAGEIHISGSYFIA